VLRCIIINLQCSRYWILQLLIILRETVKDSTLCQYKKYHAIYLLRWFGDAVVRRGGYTGGAIPASRKVGEIVKVTLLMM